MLEGLLRIALHLCLILCWVAPFSFVFCLIAAIKEAKAAANEADDDQTGDNEEPPQIGAADPV